MIHLYKKPQIRYYKSLNSFMYCDGSFGPLLMRSEVAREFVAISGYPIRRPGALLAFVHNRYTPDHAKPELRVLSCPECMFYVEEKPELTREDLLTVSRKLVTNIIKIEQDEFWFSCEDVNIRQILN